MTPLITCTSDWVHGLVYISLTGSSWSIQSQAMNNLRDSVIISEDIVFNIIELLESTIELVSNFVYSVASLLRTPLGPHYLSLIHVQCSLFIKDTIGPTLPVLNTCTV